MKQFINTLSTCIVLFLSIKTSNALDHHALRKVEKENAIQELIETVSRLETKIETLESKSKPSRSLQETCPPTFTYASTHGLTGDGSTDDTLALQAAIDAAAANTSGGTVLLPPGTFKITSPLLLKGGVTLQGQGYGSSPLQMKVDAGSSTLSYCGADYAIKIQGHAASVSNLAVYDCASFVAAGGILLDADNRGLESVRISNVLIYNFNDGTGLKLEAKNEGAIAYASFNDVRIRNAKIGMHILADGTSFANSNQVYGGAISGGIGEVALLAEGPGACNDNKFWGTVIEPPLTQITHVLVKGPKTNVKMYQVRLEGTEMFALDRPLVVIEHDSYGNVMNGMVGHTHIRADFNRNPGIEFQTAKFVSLSPPPVNLFQNAPLNNYDGTTLPFWNIPGTNRVITTLPETENLYPHHKVLNIDYLNFGSAFKLSPASLPKSPIHTSCTFGIYARSNVQGSIVATMRYESGSMITSASHSGSGQWEFIGMSALMDVTTTMGPNPTFYITGDVDVTAPFFYYWEGSAMPGASPLSSSHAVMAGTFVNSVVPLVNPPMPETPYYWVLPQHSGNIFKISASTSNTMIRLNHSTGDRFDKGTVITLLFADAGFTVKHSAYINLLDKQNFVSKENSSLMLMSNGDPTWIEISRNL